MSHATVISRGALMLAVAVALVAALPMGLAAAETTADEVISNYIDALGGKDAIESIESRKAAGTVTIVDMGLVMPMETYVKEGNFYSKTDVAAMGGMVLQGIKGDVVWSSHFMNGDAVLEGAQADDVRRQAMVTPYLNWKENFESAEVTGEADVNGEAAHVVQMTPKGGGSPSTVYFSKDSGLILKMEATGQDGMPATISFSDYKEVGGVQFPHHTDIQGMMTMSINLDSLEVNVDIPDEQFDYPAAIENIINPQPVEEAPAEEAPAEGSESN